MTVLEFDYPLPNNVKARDPVGSNKKNMDNKISLKTQIRFSLHSKENISFKNCCLLRCSNLYTICVEQLTVRHSTITNGCINSSNDKLMSKHSDTAARKLTALQDCREDDTNTMQSVTEYLRDAMIRVLLSTSLVISHGAGAPERVTVTMQFK